MTENSPYVALKAFRFGEVDLRPGDPVPVEPGRNYVQMQRVGQIGPATVTAPAGQQETGEPSSPFPKNSPLVFVGEDGANEAVTFLDVQEAPEEAAEGLGVEPGTPIALVSFRGDPDNAHLVRLDRLLPEQPTGRLVESLHARAQAEAAEAARLTKLARRQEEHIRQLEDAIASNEALAPRVAALTAERDELLKAAPIPPDALERLIAVKGVGEKLAPVILDALTAPVKEG